MSTASLIKKLFRRGATVGRTTARRNRPADALVEALEGRTLFSLLGVMPGLPATSITGEIGSLDYTASSQTFNADAVPVTFIDAAGVAHAVTDPRGFNFNIKVDGLGNLVGSGANPDDFVVTGQIDINNDSVVDYSGTLLTGKIKEFGWEPDVGTAYYDARLSVTGGALAALFAGSDIGLSITAENSNFTGDFSVNFDGKTKGIFGAIPSTGNPPLNISGHKFKDVAGNGLGGGDDTPLGGWTVQLYADTNNTGLLDAGDTLVDTTITAAGTGAYAFNGLPAGKYFVKEVGQAGWVATGPASGQYTVDLTNADANNIDFANYKCKDCPPNPCDPKPPCKIWEWITNWFKGGSCGGDNGGDDGGWTWSCFGGHWGKVPTNTSNSGCQIETLETARSSIAGSVFKDSNDNGKLDWCESGIAGVKITLTGTDLLGNIVNKTTYTDDQGNYKFSNLVAGNYTITETQPANFIDGKDYAGSNGGTVGNDVISNITLPPCSDLKCYNFTECKAASLGGKVFVDKDGDGNQDCYERGLAGVKMTLKGVDDLGNSVCLTVVTDCYGNFNFTGLRAGTYTLIESQPSGYNSTRNSTGSEGGCITGDKISNITLECGDRACGYSFGEKPSYHC